MFKSYFRIAIRQLLKQKMYTTVKVGGFALSIAACLLIALYIRHEVSYDSYYPQADRLYRLVGELTDNGISHKDLSMFPPMKKALEDDCPEVELAARVLRNRLFTGAGSNQMRLADNAENTYEDGFAFADPELLELFSIPMIYGDRQHALDGPNTIVISKRKADKYFPGQDPVGKVLILNDDLSKPYRIGGVMADFPSNSHLDYDFLISLKGVELWKGEQNSWGSSNYEIYVKLREGSDPEKFSKTMSDIILNKYFIPEMRQAGNKMVEKIGTTLQLRIYAQPVKDIHLKSIGFEDSRQYGDIRLVWLFGAIALFILIIACINFINLSTARSANRAKEVGLKKAIGSYRSDLVKQFLAESLLYSYLSFAIGICLAWLLLPFFNTLADKSLSFPWTAWWLAPVLITAAFVIGIVAGIYPAFYLSSFKPIAVLKGRVSSGVKNSNLRSALVVFQFTASIILIIGTFVIYRQMQYILNKELGYGKDQVLIVQGANQLGREVNTFKEELLKLRQVKNVSISDFLPVTGTKRNGNPIWKEGKTKEDVDVQSQFWTVDADYIKTLGMQIVAGRDFSKDIRTDSQGIVINQLLAAKLFPGGEDPVGKRITNGGSTYTVLGIVKNFYFETMRLNIEPLCMTLGYSPTMIAVKLNGDGKDMQQTIAAVTKVWKDMAPHQPFRYTFLDERFANMYADVERTGNIFTSFAILAIIIACLGLFALSAFMAEQRSKEISIRKVLGASVTQVTTLISKDFVKLVLISVLLASPIAWYAMKQWLQDFAYQVSISWWIFLVTGGIVIVIALITISFQSVKAAIANPVDSLKSE
ncbi:ABC transporter permease [Chitinophaga tropicalis]|uniref:FtsX-like permease family protein n=1 Tax=Chitinophaga tropicalis TaxID=2683588 RepID=A0A7K1U4P5_9BACT|nr:ABC transporter permease [Chitinophaga tropicalis]MVT09328.1 FtsX-like permease family protein [Chitinophaga tropicalis]